MSYAEKLREIVGADNVHTDELELICYSRDMSVHEGVADVLVFPQSTAQVSEIMKLANKKKIPVTPRGAGTSVTGAIIPSSGGILLDMCKMNNIKEVQIDDKYAVVEPGVVCGDLNRILAEHNYFFPPDPGSSAICTLGGMVSTNASGLRAVKYGTTKDYVLGLQVVLANGDIVRMGTKAPKTSSGYDLTRLFVNSEGTLGIVTEITIKIVPKPQYVAIATASFQNLNDAGGAISKILAAGVALSACEIMDRISIGVVNEVMKMDLPDVEGLLIMEVDGHKEAVMEQIKSITEICREFSGINVDWSDDTKERMKMWKGRAGLVPSLSRHKEGYRLIPIAEDFGVPTSKIPDAIKGIQEIAKRNDMTIAAFGHVGDGNVHSTFIIDVRKQDEWDKIEIVGKELVGLALTLDGTISAEHGTGMAKSPFIGLEHGSGMDVMRRIKGALDPNNILNPGKMGLDKGRAHIYDNFAFSELLAKGEVMSFGKEIDDEILICVQCGFCRAGCPVFAEEGLESHNARGRVLLAYSLLTGKLEPSVEIGDRLYKCTTCANCTATCPSGIKVVDIVEKVRQRLAGEGLGRPEHEAIKKNIQEHHNPFGEDVKARKALMEYARGVPL
ncbi:MAG: FAD-binding protein [Thermoplasmata archaeon]|nr:MAG: FAD-binding protein [Thermoplasmata archaeon]